MNTLDASQNFPVQQVPQLGGGTLALGQPGRGHDWQMVAERSGAFFYAPIDGDMIRRANTDLLAATEPGALVLMVDSVNDALRRQWIAGEKINRDGTLCLNDEAG